MSHPTAYQLARFTVIASFLYSSAHGQDWVRFRGPNGSGVSTSVLPATWTKSEVAFDVQLPGVGHSCPVILGDKLFIQSADADSAKQYVLCLNSRTGNEIWRKEFDIDSYHIHARNSFASVTPTVDKHHVYVAWSTPDQTTATAFNHNGEIVWQRELGAFDSQHGFGTSPIVYKDLVILCHQQKKPDRNGPRTETSSIVGMNRMTGEIVWRTSRWSDTASYSVPCILETEGKPDQLICCSTTDGIFSLDPLTGEENWKNEVFSMRTVSSPQLAGGLIFGSTGSGASGNYVVALRGGKDSEIAYKVERQAPYVPTPVFKDGLGFLWFDKGIVTCIDAATGEQHWQKRIGNNFSGSPVIAGDKVYCIAEDGEVFVIAASTEYQLLGTTPLGEDSRSTPAIANGRIYFRTNSRLICVGTDRDL
ncbi:MAG: PQQ-binding-like beta-propeller repeat protein [Planctomycetales bacterium]|nr:PQQ-binding-like beta-propeller repeat protein [Planctomycetales bacterium]